MTYTEFKNEMPNTYTAIVNSTKRGSAEFLDTLTTATEHADIFIDLITANHIELTCGNTDEPTDMFTDLMTQMLLEIFRNNRKAKYIVRKDGLEVFVFNHFSVAIDYNVDNIFDN